MAVAGIIFDKDGTLFDLQATWAPSAARLSERLAAGDEGLRARLCGVLGYDARLARLRPGSLFATETPRVVQDAVVAALPPGTDSERVGHILAEEATTVRQIPAVPLRPLFAALRHRGLRLACVTNDSEDAARAHLEEAGVASAFDAILGYDSGHGAKPGPGPFLAAATRSGLRPPDTIVIGDSRYDMAAAVAAGMRRVGVLTGAADREDLMPPAEAVLNHVGELPDWLDDNAPGDRLRPHDPAPAI